MSVFRIDWLPSVVTIVVLTVLGLVALHALYRLTRFALKSRWIKRAQLVAPVNGSRPGLGDAVRLGVELLTRRGLTFREIRLRLYCRETSIERGAVDRAVTATSHRQEVVWNDVALKRRRERTVDTEFVIPAEAMHTVEGEHHYIEWIAEADIVIRRGMTRHLRRRIEVAPVRRSGV